MYERLIEDLKKSSGKEMIDCIKEVYASWISDAISNYNTDFIINPEIIFMSASKKDRFVHR